ncbi:MAG TPA: hypothetical protein VFC53_01580 [Dehalococcoidia bacterium]|nr:hypothetical protein [Dehalococcoidia bacterium]
MAVKPDARRWTIREQVVEDPVSGLTLQFDVLPDGTFRLRVIGDIPFGNRDLIFNAQGEEAGGGVGLTGAPRPGWLRPSD